MARQAHGTIWQDLHSLIAAKRLEVAEIELQAAILGRDDVLDLAAVSVLAIGSKAHDFALIAIFRIADEFTNHRIEASQRVRKEDPVQHVNLVALTASSHRRDEIAGTVIAEARRFLPRRAVVRA